MDETLITWNMTNWITVVLMVFLGFLALSVVAQFVRKAMPSAAA